MNESSKASCIGLFREMFAVIKAIKKWHQYLVGQSFHIYTEKKNLRHLLSQTIQTPEQQKWTSKLQGYNFELFYNLEKSNTVADELSQQNVDDTLLLFVTSSPVPTILDKIRNYYTSDSKGQFCSINTPLTLQRQLLLAYRTRYF